MWVSHVSLKWRIGYYTTRCSRCSTLLVSSLSLISRWKEVFLLNIDFTIAILDLVVRVHLASFVVCHATQIIEIFHIMQLFLVCHNLWWGWLPWDAHYLRFFFLHSFPFHSIFQFHLVYQSCCVLLFLPQPVAQDHLCIWHCELLVLLFGCIRTLQEFPW